MLDKEELDELIKVKEEGRLVVLPCKVGDTVYYTLCGRIFLVTVKQFRTNALQEWKVVIAFDSNYKEILDCVDFGKTVFLTREEAEKALAGGPGQLYRCD